MHSFSPGYPKPIGTNRSRAAPEEWTLHETVAHLVALNGAGLESIQHALRGEPYTFIGLDNRYELNAYNRKGIDDHLDIPMKELCAKFLDILDEAASIARDLRPDQAELTVQMSIYNRPVRIVEALSIIMVHAGLFHAAQVAEPAGLPPLWMQLSPEIPPSCDRAGDARLQPALPPRYWRQLAAILVFRVDGPDGGKWHVDLSLEKPISGEGVVERPGLTIHLRDTAAFCRLFTGRLNLPVVLLSGQMKLRGDLRLFLRMNTLFSVDARPPVAHGPQSQPLPSTWRGEQAIRSERARPAGRTLNYTPGKQTGETRWKSHATGD